MVIHIKKWGNSASVRIPASIMAAADLSLDQEVDVRLENGLIIIEPVRKIDLTLDEMLDRLDPETIPGLVDFGPPVGKEVW